jgi:hypothetical protein
MTSAFVNPSRVSMSNIPVNYSPPPSPTPSPPPEQFGADAAANSLAHTVLEISAYGEGVIDMDGEPAHEDLVLVELEAAQTSADEKSSSDHLQNAVGPGGPQVGAAAVLPAPLVVAAPAPVPAAAPVVAAPPAAAPVVVVPIAPPPPAGVGLLHNLSPKVVARGCGVMSLFMGSASLAVASVGAARGLDTFFVALWFSTGFLALLCGCALLALPYFLPGPPAAAPPAHPFNAPS